MLAPDYTDVQSRTYVKDGKQVEPSKSEGCVAGGPLREESVRVGADDRTRCDSNVFLTMSDMNLERSVATDAK